MREVLQPTTFQTFKEETTFTPESDYFDLEKFYGACESGFVKWLKTYHQFVRRFSAEQGDKSLYEMVLPINKWFRYAELYEAHCVEQYILTTFPESGYFECSNDEKTVAAFLPEPTDEAKYRIAYYLDNGPQTHHCFNSRQEALKELASSCFKVDEGAVDRISDTLKWNRGLTVLAWHEEGLMPSEGYNRDKHLPHIKREFASEAI